MRIFLNEVVQQNVNVLMSQCCIMIKYNYMVFKYLHGAEVDKRV